MLAPNMNWPTFFQGTGTLLLTFFAAYLAYLYQRFSNAEEERERLVGILRAIVAELEVLGDAYKGGSGGYLNTHKPGSAYLRYFLADSDYFLVYKNNTEIFGRIRDYDLSKRIVRVYNLMFLLIEQFNVNNGYLKSHEEAENNGLADLYLNHLCNHSHILLHFHAQTKKESEELLTYAQRYITEKSEPATFLPWVWRYLRRKSPDTSREGRGSTYMTAHEKALNS